MIVILAKSGSNSESLLLVCSLTSTVPLHRAMDQKIFGRP
jgi:hypothetical protein